MAVQAGGVLADRRGMANRFIPSGDNDFLLMARSFSSAITEECERFGISSEEARSLAVQVEAYKAKLDVVLCRATRSPTVTAEKEEARRALEKMIKRLALRVRATDALDSPMMVRLGMRERVARPRACPQEPPKLAFVRALHAGNGDAPRHELTFRAMQWGKTKPEGAARLELFVDLVRPGEAIPAHPGANHGGRPWYLRSYTRSPIVVAPPMTRTAMRVVYWGRWADSTGNVGPFSSTAVGWIEGGSENYLPGSNATLNRPAKLLEDLSEETATSTVSVTVMEARYQQLNPQDVTPLQLESDAA